MENGRESIVKFSFPSKVHFTNIQRYEIGKKKYKEKCSFKLDYNFQLLC